MTFGHRAGGAIAPKPFGLGRFGAHRLRVDLFTEFDGRKKQAAESAKFHRSFYSLLPRPITESEFPKADIFTRKSGVVSKTVVACPPC